MGDGQDLSQGDTELAWAQNDIVVSQRTKIYVASSWRNTRQPEVVTRLRDDGFDVYDFKRPGGGRGFAWSDIEAHGMANHDSVSPHRFLAALEHPLAVEGFRRDFAAMQAAEIFVLVLPCERDAHLELGWACGAGKETIILLDDPCKASLMYGMVDHISPTMDDLLDWLK